jgi:hypothetical protein
MNARLIRSVAMTLALLTCASAPVHATGDASAPSTPPAQKSAAKRASTRKTSAARPASAKSADAAPGAKDDKTPGLPRRLDEINIEGEIAVPQVLFVTARDQRRFMDFQQRHYVKSSLEVGTEKVFPTWIAVIHSPTADPHKETKP